MSCAVVKAPVIKLAMSVLWLSGMTAFGDSPLLHYTFDESQSGASDAIDSGSGAPANGVFNGSATRTANGAGPQSDAALSTEGGAITSHLATTNTPVKLDGLETFTLCTWVNLQSAPSLYDRLISMHSAGGSGTGFDWFIDQPLSGSLGATNFRLTLTVNTMATLSSADVTSSEDWLFLAVSYDGSVSSNNVRFYSGSASVSVEQVGAVSSLGSGAPQSTSALLRVGGTDRTALDRTPNAWFDDVRIYGAALTQSQLDDIRAEIQVQSIPERFLLMFGNDD